MPHLNDDNHADDNIKETVADGIDAETFDDEENDAEY